MFLFLILIFFVYHVYFFFSPLNFPLYDYYPQHYFFFYSSLNFPLYYCHYDRLHYLQDHKLELTDQVALEATGNAVAIARILEPHVARVVIANGAAIKGIGATETSATGSPNSSVT